MSKKIILLFLFWSSFAFAQNSKEEKFVALFTTGVQCLEKQEVDKAITNLEAAYTQSIALYGDSSVEMAQVCFYLAAAYMDINSEKALENILKTSVVFRKEFGASSAENAQVLSLLGSVYLDLEAFDKAKETYRYSQALAKNIYGENSINYGVSCTNTAAAFLKMADFNAALLYMDEGLAILNNQAEFPNAYYNNLRYNNLPFIYEGLGRFDDALAIYEESLHHIKKLYGNRTVNYAHILQSVGMVQLKIGLLSKAEQSFLQSVDILSRAEDNAYEASLANAYMGLAVYYTQSYDYESAIYYSNLALEINETLEVNYLQYDITYYEILSNLYFEIGNTSFAKALLEKAKDKSKELYGENSLEFATQLSNYAKLVRYFDIEKSKELATNAIGIAEKIDVDSPQYQLCLLNLIPILLDDNKIEEALAIVKKSLLKIDTSSSVYWEHKMLLGELHLINKKYQEAEKILEETTEAIAKMYGKNSPKYANALVKYIEALYYQKEYTNLTTLIKSCNLILVNQVKDFFKFASEQPKYTYLNTLKTAFNFFQEIGYELKDDEALALLNYENQLLLKGLLLNTSKDLITKLSELNDPKINNLITTFLQKKNQLVKNNVLQQKDLDGLTMEIINLENELTDLFNIHFKTVYHSQFKKSFNAVQNHLKSNEVAIEFATIEISNRQDENTKFVYVAYLVQKGFKYPKLIVLGNENELQNILKSSVFNPNKVYTTRGSSANKVGAKVGAKELYQLLWKPFEPFLNFQDTVYFTLDGILHQIPMALLTNEANEMLLENYQLVQLSSTFDVTKSQIEPTLDTTLLVGGITYDYEPKQPNDNQNKNKNAVEISKLENQTHKKKWNYLPATLTEIKNIASLFEKSKIPYLLLSDTLATETKIKALDKKSPSVIHIATHGYFYENNNQTSSSSLKMENVFQFSNDPLLRSGLLLSGANYAWINGSNPYENEDGILTAQEISNLDLNTTDLVILSACETGLGDVDGHEGVYGLQRAFKKAGVKKMIMSLWEVPDQETAEFMELLYANWFSGLTLKQSFTKAQLEMSKLYRDEPLKWAAFFLLE